MQDEKINEKIAEKIERLKENYPPDVNSSFKWACGSQKPTSHECDSLNMVLSLRSGELVPDTPENVEKYKGEINGGSVSCSQCGYAPIVDAYWMD